MRRARGFRVTSTRDVCIFCATRQLATEAPLARSAIVQRRHLNSSSRAPQNAEGQVYREERPAAPARPMSLAERARQAALARQPAPPPPPPPPPPQQYTAQSRSGDRPRTSSQSQYPARNAPSRSSQPRSSNLSTGYAPQSNARYGGPPRERPRYNVNMDARMPLGETPQFEAGHLRQRGRDAPVKSERPLDAFDLLQQTSASEAAKRPPQIRRKLDQNELDRLLGTSGSGNRSTKERPVRERMQCSHCGRPGHTVENCFALHPRAQPYSGRQAREPARTPSLADEAQAWVQKWKGSEAAQSQEVSSGWYANNEPRRKTEERRSTRQWIDHGQSESRNRYEQPERRGRYESKGRNNKFMRDDDDDRYASKAERKAQRKAEKQAAKLAEAAPTPIQLPQFISVANLAVMLRQRVGDFVAKLEELGFEDVQNDHILNSEHAGLIAQEYNFEPIIEGEDGDLYPTPPLEPEEYAKLPTRPPVVTIMGHVDHGKTTILDYMRSSSVAASEFGGITQHIGAFSVPLSSGKSITFLDTPGHSAFETMRARGANVTDIVVLVVAADDSVMPQTVEAIKHAHAAQVPILVAINKIDKQQADPEKVKMDLGRHGIEVEDFGGDVQAIAVSGMTGEGISDLEEAISLQSEMLDHRADPTARVEGWVLEGSTKKSGLAATVLVRSGTLRQGDILVAGTTWARVRTLKNEAGALVDEVGPGMPVEVNGWRRQPIAGDEVLQAEDEQHANQVSELRQQKLERVQMGIDMQAVNESRRLEAERRAAEEAAKLAEKNGETIEQQDTKIESGPAITSFIVKGDVSGSVEAVIDSISSIGNNEVGVRVLRHGVGSPSEFDVQHAADAGGYIVNFNTVIPQHISQMAANKGVEILDSNIIYRVVENVRALLSEKLPPKITQRVTGEAEIAAIFEIGLGGRKKMTVAGSKVRNGQVEKGAKVKVLRNDKVIYEGTITSLKNQKKDADVMRKDTECGIAFEGWEDFQVGDKIQCFEEKSEKRTL